MNENVRISIKISLKFVSKGLINNIPALAQIMAWPRPGDKPLSEPMMVNLLTPICVTRPQWVKDQAPVYEIYGYTIFARVAVTCDSDSKGTRVEFPAKGMPYIRAAGSTGPKQTTHFWHVYSAFMACDLYIYIRMCVQ